MHFTQPYVRPLGFVTKIVTHHRYPRDAAEAWARDSVCAVGFVTDPNHVGKDVEAIRGYFTKSGSSEAAARMDAASFIRFRDEMKEGDVVLAYVCDNTVGLVGVVRGKMLFDDENETGGDFCYPNQRPVDWLDSPRFFSRNYLPGGLKDWVCSKGTILRIEYDLDRLVERLSNIEGASRKVIERTVLHPIIGRPGQPGSRGAGQTEPLVTQKYIRISPKSVAVIERKHAALVNSFRLWLIGNGFKEVILERENVDIRFVKSGTSLYGRGESNSGRIDKALYKGGCWSDSRVQSLRLDTTCG